MFQVRGLNATPEVNALIDQYHGINFDEAGLGRALHIRFLGDLESVYITFAHLNEKRNSDADDVAHSYIATAQAVIRGSPNGALADGLRSSFGHTLLDLLYAILDSGWTTSEERAQMSWLKQLKRAKSY